MNAYTPRTADMQFLLSRVLNAPAKLQALPAFAEVDPELMQQVLDEAGKFVGEVIAPLNRDGDEIGAQWQGGAVTMPPGFKDAYQAFWQAGWPALAASAEDGGQGLPTKKWKEEKETQKEKGRKEEWMKRKKLRKGTWE